MSAAGAEVEAAARSIFEYMEDRPWATASALEVDFFRSAARLAISSGEAIRAAGE